MYLLSVTNALRVRVEHTDRRLMWGRKCSLILSHGGRSGVGRSCSLPGDGSSVGVVLRGAVEVCGCLWVARGGWFSSSSLSSSSRLSSLSSSLSSSSASGADWERDGISHTHKSKQTHLPPSATSFYTLPGSPNWRGAAAAIISCQPCVLWQPRPVAMCALFVYNLCAPSARCRQSCEACHVSEVHVLSIL